MIFKLIRDGTFDCAGRFLSLGFVGASPECPASVASVLGMQAIVEAHPVSDLWKLPCKRISLEAFGDWGMTYFESRTAFCLVSPRLRRSPLLLVPSIGGHMSRFAARL